MNRGEMPPAVGSAGSGFTHRGLGDVNKFYVMVSDALRYGFSACVPGFW